MTIGSGLADKLIERSADWPTLVTAVAVLLARKGSGWTAVARAVAEMAPNCSGVTFRVAVANVFLVSKPALKITVLPATTTEPCDRSTELMRTVAGSVLVTVTPEAAAGPLLVTETV